MTIIRGEKICMPEPCVLAVGKFECFHLGHRTLIMEMMRLAGLASALVMFEPHPYRVLADADYKPLFTECEREYLAKGLGVDYLLEYPFDRDFAALSPEDFSHMLFGKLKARVVVVGEGYRFGHKRGGTVDTLQRVASGYDARVHVVAPFGAGKTANFDHNPQPYETTPKISTSAIRELLSASKMAEAESLLGYPFFIMGTITPGRQIGRTIGFPTINLYPPCEKFLPPDGVYATRVALGESCYYGVTDAGLRPTVNLFRNHRNAHEKTGRFNGFSCTHSDFGRGLVESAGATRSVETYLFDFEGGELYGRQVRIEFLQFIRPERKFESLDALRAQIAEDCRMAKQLSFIQPN